MTKERNKDTEIEKEKEVSFSIMFSFELQLIPELGRRGGRSGEERGWGGCTVRKHIVRARTQLIRDSLLSYGVRPCQY